MGAEHKIDLDNLINHEAFADRLSDSGFDKNEARLILAESATMNASPESVKNFQRHFDNSDGSINVEKTAAYSHINAKRETLRSYLPVLNDRAANDAAYEEGDSRNLDELNHAVQMMHAAGYSAKDMVHVFNNLIKISKSATSHPTEGLSKNGVILARNLVEAAENSDPQVLDDAVKAIIDSNDFEATEKSNTLDEIDEDNDVSRIHNKGVNDLDRAVEYMIFDTTGERVEISSNTAPRSWAYDSDGKNNAEGFSMMAKMATTKVGALTDLVESLKIAQAQNISDDFKDSMEAVQNDVQKIIDRLQPVHDETRKIILELAKLEPEKREAFYRKNYTKSFESLFKDFSNIYDEVDNGRNSEAF